MVPMSEAFIRVWRIVSGPHRRELHHEMACSDFLFARPSFWSGFARVVDLGATFDSYNISRTSEEADARALWADWRVIGQDLFAAGRAMYPDFPHVDDRRPPDARVA